jgi:hypothetical protein
MVLPGLPRSLHSTPSTQAPHSTHGTSCQASHHLVSTFISQPGSLGHVAERFQAALPHTAAVVVSPWWQPGAEKCTVNLHCVSPLSLRHKMRSTCQRWINRAVSHVALIRYALNSAPVVFQAYY